MYDTNTCSCIVMSLPAVASSAGAEVGLRRVTNDDAIDVEVVQGSGQEDIAESSRIGLRQHARPKRRPIICEDRMAGLDWKQAASKCVGSRNRLE